MFPLLARNHRITRKVPSDCFVSCFKEICFIFVSGFLPQMDNCITIQNKVRSMYEMIKILDGSYNITLIWLYSNPNAQVKKKKSRFSTYIYPLLK